MILILTQVTVSFKVILRSVEARRRMITLSCAHNNHQTKRSHRGSYRRPRALPSSETNLRVMLITYPLIRSLQHATKHLILMG